MKLWPSSQARFSTSRAAARSGGSPHTSRPVTRIAPKPRRFTVKSPTLSVPAAAAGFMALAALRSLRLEPRGVRRFAIARDLLRQEIGELRDAHRSRFRAFAIEKL